MKHRLVLSSGEVYEISNEDQQKIINMISGAANSPQKYRWINMNLTAPDGTESPQVIVFLDHIVAIGPGKAV